MDRYTTLQVGETLRPNIASEAARTAAVRAPRSHRRRSTRTQEELGFKDSRNPASSVSMGDFQMSVYRCLHDRSGAVRLSLVGRKRSVGSVFSITAISLLRTLKSELNVTNAAFAVIDVDLLLGRSLRYP